MVSMTALILPIVISAVLVFMLSAFLWMAAPHHKGEWKALSHEDAVRTALQKPTPGLYMIPYAGTPEARKDPAFLRKLQEGPVAMITVSAGRGTSMGPMMVQSIVFYLIVSSIVGYVAIHGIPAGASYLKVFQVVGTMGWLAYGFGSVSESIWFGRPWSATAKQVVDALLMGMVTAGTFGWLWPR
jgi:hypothetical protein